MGNKTINIPDLGEAEDVEVIEVCAKVGDQVGSEDPIIVLESDKAAMEIPASAIGKVISIEVSVGDTVNSGSPFLQIEVSDDAAEKDEKVPPKNTDQKNATKFRGARIKLRESKKSLWSTRISGLISRVRGTVGFYHHTIQPGWGL